MRAVSLLIDSKLAHSAGLQSSVVAVVKSSAKAVVEACNDDGYIEKKVTECLFSAQGYRLEKVWLAVLQIDKVQIALRDVSKNMWTTRWSPYR